jgi:hypothetical protein
LQEAKKEYIMAILFAPSWEPANKMFSSPEVVSCSKWHYYRDGFCHLQRRDLSLAVV